MLKNILFLIVGAIAGVLLTFAIIEINNGLSSQTKSAAANTNAANGTGSTTKTTSIGTSPVLGNKSKAKIAIVEFSDFECPYCKKFIDDTFSQIKTNYIDTGKAIFVYRNFPLSFHQPAANKDATASLCVRDLGGDSKFYDMLQAIYQNTGLNGSGMADDKMIGLAVGLGIDKDQFSACLSSSKFTDAINKDAADGTAAGVTGTPAFVVGKLKSNGDVTGDLIVGAQTFDTFNTTIENQLSK